MGVWGVGQIFSDDYWLMICDDAFTFNNAKVFCRTLGLPESNIKYSNAYNMTFYNPSDFIGIKPDSF